MFGGICFRSVNIIWLHLLGFTSICFSCSHFSIFVICSCSNLTAVSGLVCLTSIAVSSANVSILLLVVVGMLAVYNVYSEVAVSYSCIYWTGVIVVVVGPRPV